jgi:hypothetical protein
LFILRLFNIAFYTPFMTRPMDPAGQQSSPYAFCGNSPLFYRDKNGKIFVETLIGIGISALISGGVSVGTYMAVSLANGQSITGGGLLKSFGIGALGGAISGGISSIGGLVGNQFAFGVLGRVGSYAATNAVNDKPLTLNGLIGLGVSGALAGAMPAFNGVDGGGAGGAVANIAGETIYDAGVGGMSSGVGMGIESMLSGGNFFDGFTTGLVNGAIGGGVNAALKNATFGYIEQLDAKRNETGINGLKDMESDFAAAGKGLGDHKQIFRSGGLMAAGFKLFDSYIPGYALGGQNLHVKKQFNNKLLENQTVIHEGFHTYQNNEVGFARFLGRGVIEQFIIGRGVIYDTPGTMEWAAENAKRFYYKPVR